MIRHAAALAALLALAGCDDWAPSYGQPVALVDTGGLVKSAVYGFDDPETGCRYLATFGRGTSFSPRLRRDGSVDCPASPPASPVGRDPPPGGTQEPQP